MKEKIIANWKKYKGEMDYGELKKSKWFANMFDVFEAEVLYSLVRHIKPKRIVEMSPARGFTSLLMINACEKNDNQASIYSYDLDDMSQGLDRGGAVFRQLIIGDVKDTLDPEDLKRTDFLFIDSDHSREFAEWYCKNLIKELRKDTLIWIHDWNGYDTKKDEQAKVKEYCSGPRQLCEPIINLMDYYEENILMRKADKRGDRSPSQILRRV